MEVRPEAGDSVTYLGSERTVEKEVPSPMSARSLQAALSLNKVLGAITTSGFR